MASFHTCPRELTDSILEELPTRDLAAVSLTSKKLHAAATPLLYSRIHFSIYRNDPRPFIYLCRTIFKNPELAAYIKSVRLHDGAREIQKLYKGGSYSFGHMKEKPCLSKPTEEDGMRDFVAFVTDSGLPYTDLWIEQLREGNLNAFVALLLSRLPNLASFRVGYTAVLAEMEGRGHNRLPPKTKGENQFLGKIFQSAAFDASNHGLSRFRHLQEISYPSIVPGDPGRNPDFCNPRDLMALLSLPSMRSLSGWSLNPNSFPVTWPAGPPDLSQLTSLSLSYVNEEFLAHILERTQNLKKLKWEWYCLPELIPPESATVDLDRFMEAIKPCQDTLEDLTIDCINTMGDNQIEMGFVEMRGSLNGLKSFANIKRFKAPFTLLLPDWEWEPNEARRLEDSMPPNVEIVTVTDQSRIPNYGYEEEDEMAKLRAWITETVATRTPKLVEICFYLTVGSDWVMYEKYEDFEKVFEGSSLRYSIVKEKEEEPWNDV